MPSQSKELKRRVAQYARAVKEIGNELQELLRKEDWVDRKLRARTLKKLESALDDEKNTESVITSVLDQTKASLERLTKQSNMAIARENALEDKIHKKNTDVERSLFLLSSLNTNDGVHPAHQAEYDRLEEELQVEYDRYVVRVRNVDYLEAELRSYQKLLLEKRERNERSLKHMRDKFFREEEDQRLQERLASTSLSMQSSNEDTGSSCSDESPSSLDEEDHDSDDSSQF